MSMVNDLIKEIKDNLSQTSSSVKDEERVMRALLNDKEYKAMIYTKNEITPYSPYEETREMVSGILATTTGMSYEEASKLANDYEFKKNDAQALVNLSKEFIHTYIDTGRKLPLGGRKDSDINMSKKVIEEGYTTYPKKVGIDSNGKGIYENTKVPVKAHTSIKIHNKTPEWVK